MSDKQYPAPELAFRVWGLSMLAIVAWIVAAFTLVILKHP
jgi:hypothetical protein